MSEGRATSAVGGEAFYFGCWGGIGHLLYDRSGRTIYGVRHPWGVGHCGIDGTLAPGVRDPRLGDVRDVDQHQGLAALVHKDGWTALAFWDRSVDRRAGSNSVFIFPRVLTAEEAIEAARAAFPNIWARFSFEVRVK